MSIVKIVKRDCPYVTIDKTGIDDPNLSWGATGLLTYLIGRPSNWKISIAHLSKVKKCRETATKSVLKELREFNYCHYFVVRKNGKISETFYLVFEVPTDSNEIVDHIESYIDIKDVKKEDIIYQPVRNEKRGYNKKPQVENQLLENNIENKDVLPQVDFPQVENLIVENQGLLNKDYTNNRITNNKTTTSQVEKIKNSSSSLEENNLEKNKIKEVLKNYNLSKITKNNIIKLYLKNLVTTDRIIRVFEVAKEKEWGDGAIYKALKENWNIEPKKENKIILSKDEIKEKIKGRINYYLNSMRETDNVEEVKNKLMIDINSIENIKNFKELVVEYLSKFDVAIKEKKESKEIIKEREEKNITVTILKNGEAEDNENNSLSFIKKFLMLDENLKDEIFIKAEKLFKGSKEMLLMFKKINITGYVNTIIREIKTVINSDYKEINYLLQ